MKILTLSLPAAILTAVLCLGCEESVEPEPAVTTPTPAADPTETDTLRSTGGTGSALGSARQAADNTVDRLQQRQDDMIREIEDINDGD